MMKWNLNIPFTVYNKKYIWEASDIYVRYHFDQVKCEINGWRA